LLRLAEEQVNVFWHHHITEQLETVSGTHFVKHSHEAIAGVPRPEEWASPVTTEGNKVEVASSVMAS